MAVKVTLDDAKLQQLITHTGGDVTRYVADGMEYGIHQELGTVRQGYAQPFMRPAVEGVRPGFEQAFHNKLTDAEVTDTVDKTARDVEAIAKDLAPVDTGALRNSIHVSKDAPGGMGGGLWFATEVP